MGVIRARYTFERAGDVVFIVDRDDGKSVTNDAEAVIRDLRERGIDVDRVAIVYRDTMGIWDQIQTKRGAFSGFRSLGGTSDRIEAGRLAAESIEPSNVNKLANPR
jgi:hypothetical protein